jgi:hypothetical protein
METETINTDVFKMRLEAFSTALKMVKGNDKKEDGLRKLYGAGTTAGTMMVFAKKNCHWKEQDKKTLYKMGLSESQVIEALKEVNDEAGK